MTGSAGITGLVDMVLEASGTSTAHAEYIAYLVVAIAGTSTADASLQATASMTGTAFGLCTALGLLTKKETQMLETLYVERFRARSLEVGRVELTWEAYNSYADPRNFTMQIWRSESPEGPFDPISPAFEDRYSFVDAAAPYGDFFRKLWYRLRVTHKSSKIVTDYPPVSVEAEAGLVAQAVRKQQMTALTQVMGRQVWLFQKRTFGMRCPSCYDPKLRQKTRSMCLTCFDAGFLRGYLDPVEIWAQIDPAIKQVQLLEMQKSQGTFTSGRTGYYPSVKPGDVIVEAENKRWRVVKVSQSEHLRATVHQELDVLYQIQEGDIEYKLPINLAEPLRDLQPSPGRMFTLPSDLESTMLERTPDIFANYPTYPRKP